ncbi:MAG: undecaprenyl-diphosphate phosphatase [Thermomicrobiales bacterium]
MDILRAILLGVVQGLTEFLPISSSAHLIIFPWLFGWEPFGLAFDVALHLGTLTAILAYFRQELVMIPRGLIAERREIARGHLPVDPMARLGIFIVIATLPAAIVGLLAEGAIDEAFHGDPVSRTAIAVIAVVLLVVGLVLELADRRGSMKIHSDRDVTFRQAITIGFAQTLALIPGASRSGTTITAGLFVGLSRADAARFSFLLGVPLIAGAGAKQLLEIATGGLGDVGVDVFVIGIVTAALTGYVAIAGLLRFLQRRPVTVFVVYRVLVGIGLLILLASGFNG